MGSQKRLHVFFPSQMPCAEDPVVGKASRSPVPTVVDREDTGCQLEGSKGQRCQPSAMCLGDGLVKWDQGLETNIYPADKGLSEAHPGPRGAVEHYIG